MQGATKIDALRLKQQEFQNKHSEALLDLSERFGDTLYRQDVQEVAMLSTWAFT